MGFMVNGHAPVYGHIRMYGLLWRRVPLVSHLLALISTLRTLLGTLGNSWIQLGALGYSWIQLGTLGHSWAPLGTLGYLSAPSVGINATGVSIMQDGAVK